MSLPIKRIGLSASVLTKLANYDQLKGAIVITEFRS